MSTSCISRQWVQALQKQQQGTAVLQDRSSQLELQISKKQAMLERLARENVKLDEKQQMTTEKDLAHRKLLLRSVPDTYNPFYSHDFCKVCKNGSINGFLANATAKAGKILLMPSSRNLACNGCITRAIINVPETSEAISQDLTVIFKCARCAPFPSK